MSFIDKVVVITGGSSGVGASVAIAFSVEGADVCIVGRNEGTLADVAEQCSNVGKPPLIIKADVGVEDDAKNIIERVIDQYGKLNILINNAGLEKMSNIGDDDYMKTYDETMKIHMRAVVLITSLASKYIQDTKGNIINISSAAALKPFGKGYSAYCVSKAALSNFSRFAAFELAEFGVRVNTVSPGLVETQNFDSPREEFDSKQIADTTALRTKAQPKEVADLVLYLASDKAKNITASEYVIDAGYLIQ